MKTGKKCSEGEKSMATYLTKEDGNLVMVFRDDHILFRMKTVKNLLPFPSIPGFKDGVITEISNSGKYIQIDHSWYHTGDIIFADIIPEVKKSFLQKLFGVASNG